MSDALEPPEVALEPDPDARDDEDPLEAMPIVRRLRGQLRVLGHVRGAGYERGGELRHRLTAAREIGRDAHAGPGELEHGIRTGGVGVIGERLRVPTQTW